MKSGREQWPRAAEPHRPGREAGPKATPETGARKLEVQHIWVLTAHCGCYSAGLAKRPRCCERNGAVARRRSEFWRRSRQDDDLMALSGEGSGEGVRVVADAAGDVRQRAADETDLHRWRSSPCVALGS